MPHQSKERISLGDLADELQTRPQAIHKIVNRLGIHTEKRRDPERGNQFVSTVSTADIPAIRDTLEKGR